MLVDSHCHVHFPELAGDLPAVLGNMREAGVGAAVTVCTEPGEVEALRKLVAEHESLYASVGIHPNSDRSIECDPQELLDAYRSHDKFVAIGECGLDYFRGGREAREWQLGRMALQAEVALEAGAPLIVHTRDSIDDAIADLGPYARKGLRAVLHCFTGTQEQADRALDAGFMLSFTGIVTFKSAKDLLAVAASVPQDRFMVETDAPYLAPEPHRGERNEPAFVRHTLARIAEARGVDPAELERTTTENAISFYGLPLPA